MKLDKAREISGLVIQLESVRNALTKMQNYQADKWAVDDRVTIAVTLNKNGSFSREEFGMSTRVFMDMLYEQERILEKAIETK